MVIHTGCCTAKYGKRIRKRVCNTCRNSFITSEVKKLLLVV